jgi:hypothetical protein
MGCSMTTLRTFGYFTGSSSMKSTRMFKNGEKPGTIIEFLFVERRTGALEIFFFLVFCVTAREDWTYTRMM